MDTLTTASTLDDEYFKKHFGADYKEAAKDAEEPKPSTEEAAEATKPTEAEPEDASPKDSINFIKIK